MNTKELLKDFEKNFPLIDKDLFLDVPYEVREKEFFFFLDTPGKFNMYTMKNKLVKYYLQANFYKKERELWENDDIKIRIIENRCKYLNKPPHELTTYDILSGFKKSGIHYGYSGFNPLLAKWFFEKYNTKICYDPCGGWGHRLLGAMNIDKYIYNDLSYSTCCGVGYMCGDFDIYNCEIYNEDAHTFMPDDDFDTMFTCPPYYNLESYECGDFESREAFDTFINCLFEKFYKKDSCKVFGMVIREDLIGNCHYSERYLLKTIKSEHLLQNTKKKYNEYLYVFKKEGPVWAPYTLADTNKPISTKWDKEVDASNFTQAKE